MAPCTVYYSSGMLRIVRANVNIYVFARGRMHTGTTYICI